MRKSRTVLSVLLLAVVMLAGCQQAELTVEPGMMPETYEELVTSLETIGLDVEATTEEVEQSFFGVPARVVRVGGEQVQVFQFDDAQEAEDAAGMVSDDGFDIGVNHVDWDATPYFYRTGPLIILYVGNEHTVVNALSQVLGAPFAGGEAQQP
jgi:hypothetical protein